MNWADVVGLVLIATFIGLEIKRGFGVGIFTFVAAFIALKLAGLWVGPASKMMHLANQAGPNQALWLGVLFILLMVVFTLIIYLIHPDTFLSLEPFDNLLGALCGLGTGWIAANVFLSALLIWGAKDVVQASALAPEVLRFETYHSIVRALRGLGEVPPDAGVE